MEPGDEAKIKDYRVYILYCLSLGQGRAITQNTTNDTKNQSLTIILFSRLSLNYNQDTMHGHALTLSY